MLEYVLLTAAGLFAFVLINYICGLICRQWSSSSIFNPVILNFKDLSGYYCIVTGSNQGIGYETAKYLVNHGAFVVLACRNEKRGLNAEKMINSQISSNATFPNGKAKYMNCDLSILSSTKAFVHNYKSNGYPLHILINNAGMGGRNKLKLTKDGCDLTWQINYLSHFLITYELLPVMIKSCANNNANTSFDGRIINLSSVMHGHGDIDIAFYECSDEKKKREMYKGSTRSYANSKLAACMHATYLQKQIFNKCDISISTASCNPGGVDTAIFNVNKWPLFWKIPYYLFRIAWKFGMRTPEEGSRNTSYCAVAPTGDNRKKWGGNFVPGAFHENFEQTKTRDSKRQSTDINAMQQLWDYSVQKLGLINRTLEDFKKMKNTNE